MTSTLNRMFNDSLEVLNTTESILNGKLKPVPAGRPRRRGKERNEIVPKREDDLDFSDVLHELRSELDSKRREEDKLQKEIVEILSESTSVGGEQSRSFSMAASRLNNALLVVESDAKQLASSLATISQLADSISGKVQCLDVAKTRVVECLQLAGDMRDLGVCSEGVDEAINSEDFGTAAEYIHRFLTLDSAVFQLRDSTDKEAGQSVRHSYEVLTAAAARLKQIIEKRLDDAIQTGDVPSIQRFVKLFPLLKEPSSGLTRFACYLGAQIHTLGDDNVKIHHKESALRVGGESRKSPLDHPGLLVQIMTAGGTDDQRRNVLYADTLFLFFEGVAGLLEANQPLIENSYGQDKLLEFIIMLQKDVDEIAEQVFCEFNKKRRLDKQVKLAKKLLRDGLDKISDTDRLDALELDALLSEMCVMNTHTEMYWRFVRRRVGNTTRRKSEDFVVVNSANDEDEELDEESKRKKEAERQARRDERERKLDQLLNRSVVGTKMQEVLGHYILLEQYYMEDCVRKAILMDTREEGLLSSVVDDVLFVVRKCVRRATSSASVDCICAALNNGVALLETSYAQHLEIAIRAGYPAMGFAAEAYQTAQTAYNVIQHGKTVTEAGPDTQRDAFLTAVNNARGTAELVSQLKASLQAEWAKTKRSSVEQGKLEHGISQLDEVSRKINQMAAQAIDTLCSTAFRSKLKASCEAYVDISHNLTESQFAEFEAVDPFVEQFNATLDKQLAYFQPLLHDDNYQNLLLSICSEVAKQFERVILKCTFNRLGGLQLDKEFRQLSAYLSGVAGWSARERTARLSQIVSLLNVECVEEAVELWETVRMTALNHSLTTQEARRVLQLRSDLPAALLSQIKL